MQTIPFKEKGNIKMVAHRGVSGLERENTCAAFVAAGVSSYYGIETDVHVTRDGKYILFHDDNLQRLLGLDTVIEESDFDDLRAIRLKDIDGETERADLFLPTPEEYFSICKKYKKVAVFELKNRMEEKHVVALAKIAEDMGWFENTVFISFCGENLVALKKHFPNASAQYLSGDISEEKIRFMIENDLDADYKLQFVTKEFVDAMHAAGKLVNVWTVNTVEDALRAKELGVDMITTNILE